MPLSFLSPTPHLLLVDDEPDTIAPLQIWLERHGAKVTFASDAEHAEICLAAGRVDAVICDIHMPGNHRLQWVRRLTERNGAPPLFLLTGNPEIESALAAANLPVAGYFVKPPDYHELTSRLMSCIGRARLHQDLADKISGLFGASGGDNPNPELNAIFQQLLIALNQQCSKPPHSPASIDWTAVAQETIAVLEKTKGSFHSKELGALRRKLAALLPVEPGHASKPRQGR